MSLLCTEHLPIHCWLDFRIYWKEGRVLSYAYITEELVQGHLVSDRESVSSDP